jgi:predicted ArsR family transcriptional regulator
MTKLSDTQAVILSTASQREDGAVLPLPEPLKIKGGAVDKVLGSLKAKGLIDHFGTPRGNNPPLLRITRAGLEAIGVECNDKGDVHSGATEGATLADVAGVEDQVQSGEPADTQPDAAAMRRPRAGTKQALMIELLKRPEGATVEQIAAATGWQHHTIRGAISGALKKKLGLTIEATRTREVGRNRTRANGGTTVYRITGSGPETGSPSAAG